MEALIEQRMRELLKEAYSDGYHAGRRGLVYEALDEHQGSSIGQLTTEVWKLLTYHAGRGDAAQEYIEAFFTGARDWKEFRWNEVWDRMHAVEPINLDGDMYVICSHCGERLEGDGYKRGLHCPNADESTTDSIEPDANPVHCSGGSEPKAKLHYDVKIGNTTFKAGIPLETALKAAERVGEELSSKARENQYEMRCCTCHRTFFGPKNGPRQCLLCLVEEHR